MPREWFPTFGKLLKKLPEMEVTSSSPWRIGPWWGGEALVVGQAEDAAENAGGRDESGHHQGR